MFADSSFPKSQLAPWILLTGALFAGLACPGPLLADDKNPHTEAAGFREGDGSLGSQGGPHVPEPMLFDLVRPLGASRGELEVNTLAEHARSGSAEWAPEIEFAISDGLAVEFELPFEGGTLEKYKVAVQGTLGTLRGGRMIHGWQGIGYYGRETASYSWDLLYLNGAELQPRWSVFNMVGARRSDFSGERSYTALMNNSVFYDYSQKLTLGLELNHEIGQGAWRSRFAPQVHYDFNSHLHLQAGGGLSRLGEDGSTEWFTAWRLIYSF